MTAYLRVISNFEKISTAAEKSAKTDIADLTSERSWLDL